MKVLTLAAAAMLLFGTASPSFAWVPGPSNFEETVFDNYRPPKRLSILSSPVNHGTRRVRATTRNTGRRSSNT